MLSSFSLIFIATFFILLLLLSSSWIIIVLVIQGSGYLFQKMLFPSWFYLRIRLWRIFNNIPKHQKDIIAGSTTDNLLNKRAIRGLDKKLSWLEKEMSNIGLGRNWLANLTLNNDAMVSMQENIKIQNYPLLEIDQWFFKAFSDDLNESKSAIISFAMNPYTSIYLESSEVRDMLLTILRTCPLDSRELNVLYHIVSYLKSNKEREALSKILNEWSKADIKKIKDSIPDTYRQIYSIVDN